PSPPATSTLSLHDALPIFDAVLLDTDFLHRVHGGRIAVLLRGHRRRAVENDVVLIIGVAADIELRRGPVMERALLGGRACHYRRSEEHTSELQSRRDLVCR